jgi:hypothetical protein
MSMVPEAASVLLIPLVTGLVEAAKRSGFPAQHAPGLAIAIGVVLALAGYIAGVLGATDLYQAIIHGASYGLGASGLYSAARFIAGMPASTRAAGRSQSN